MGKDQRNKAHGLDVRNNAKLREQKRYAPPSPPIDWRDQHGYFEKTEKKK